MKPLRAPVNLNANYHPVGGHIQVNITNTPRRVQAQYLTVKIGAFHRHELERGANFHKNSHRKSPRTNEIDEWIRKSAKLGREIGFSAVLQEFEKKSALGTDADFLRSAADLRNVLVHRRTLPFFEMATPTDQVVAQLESIRDRMLNPPKIYPRFKKTVTVVAPGDSLEEVMRVVSRLEFSQFPVMDEGQFIGLLTENGITRWLAQRIVSSISLVDFADAKVSELVVNEERRENFIFVPRRMAITEVREKFRGNGLLEAALITEKGRRGEKLLGLINRWDLAEA